MDSSFSSSFHPGIPPKLRLLFRLTDSDNWPEHPHGAATSTPAAELGPTTTSLHLHLRLPSPQQSPAIVHFNHEQTSPSLPSHPRHSTNMAASKKYAVDFLSFVNASPTPFHAVESAKQRLLKAGFSEIKERDPWASTVKKGGRYFLTRNGSSIVAFGVGKKWKPGNGMALLGAHTDSPALRIKPISRKFGENGSYIQVGVETYGGGLWHTWFDRDLSIAGRAMVRGEGGQIVSKLIKVDSPILRIPTLAIHLDRQENFQFNKETQLFPIAGLATAELNKNPKGEEKPEGESETTEGEFKPLAAITERHHAPIVERIAKEAGVEVKDIIDFEIILYDTQLSVLGGLNDEFIYSARLDNLMMSYCATEGIIESLSSETALDDEPGIRLISLFDHEEIGSQTAQGADSNLLPAVIRRLSVLPAEGSSPAPPSTSAYEETLIKSMLWSCDQAHAVHPNYGAKYESSHRPEMNKGPVIKVNANARYATNSPGIVMTQEVAQKAGVPLQLFVVRNDSSCGSTIGPMLSAALGARTVDMGNAQLSMHSIRETGGSHDVEHAVKLFKSYFEHYSALEPTITVD
ncbi:peptidase M18 [Sphaerosporella brunnea]|uniref:aspartyl aminopeptidase n=1 Tax=Sphaerosporella brunnea TaxID=1250544 RepID=A0A5J5EYJ1_9PEZI|nr:peptidase M18 [Sphaerosporella brunnea]